MTEGQYTLEWLLDEMSKFGRPRLSRMDDGNWHAAVELNVTGSGVDFKIRSDFRHPTHLEAATVCYERMCESLTLLVAAVKSGSTDPHSSVNKLTLKP